MNWPWKREVLKPDKEHDELRQQVRSKVSDLHSQLSMLDWNVESEDGKIEMTLEGLSYEWQPFVDGMNCKLVDVGPYSGSTVVLCEIYKPFKMDRHWHFPTEVTLSLDVTMVDQSSDRVINPGESIKWEPSERHTPEFLDTGFIIVVFTPSLSPVKIKHNGLTTADHGA